MTIDRLQGFIARLEAERSYLLARAVTETCQWSRWHHLKQPCLSDQYWVEQFSQRKATAEDAARFLAAYQVARATWYHDEVAREINNLSTEVGWSPSGGIVALANSIRQATKQGDTTQRISAASKIAMFTRPKDPVFIWDKFAIVAIKLRRWKTDNKSSKSLTATFGNHDYAGFHDECSRALLLERGDGKFREAVDQVKEYVTFTNGPLSGRVKRDYFERRLLDKLFVSEGSRIMEWLAAMREPRPQKVVYRPDHSRYP